MGCNSSKDGYESQDQGGSPNPDDPKKSALLREEALKIAEEMMGLTRGKRFHENYTRLTLTSYGASCKVLTAYHRTTNKKVAVKTIPKSRKQLERQRQKVMLEIGTFRMVEDHPNAVRVLEIFEGAECYYIVMECCEGGELFDHISKKQGCFTERQAAGLLRSLMLFLAHMHSKGIAHLDIKPENLMFDSEGASGVLKVLDFGSSVFVQSNETVRNAFGTVRYASPEMANDVCGQKADIWSAGVVMYILLCGRAPFLKGSDVDTLNFIKNGPRVRFSGERWTSISQTAKDCIRTMLDPNPRSRPAAVDVLAMPWLKQQVPETEIVPDTLKHLRTFANQSRIRRLLLGLMADQLVGSGANQLLGQFYSLDKDFSGTVEISELVKAAKEAIPELSEGEITRMFEALDVDRTGTVDVKEFFAGLIQTIDEEKQTLVAQRSFTILDKRGSGYVTKEAFMEVLIERAQAGTLKMMGSRATALGSGSGSGTVPADLAQLGSEELKMHGRQSGPDGGEAQVILDPGLVHELEAEFAYLDANGDGVLSFEEFKAILGIQSTPEGLTLAQPQIGAVPSIQEGMETLAQTLRTRTCSKPKEEQHRQGSMQRLTLGRVSHSGTGGGGGAGGGVGGLVSGGGAAASAGGAVSGGGGAANAAARQRSSGGHASNNVTTVQPLSVDRAQLDLELPCDLETRDLLQILAPAKRTASQAQSLFQLSRAGDATTPAALMGIQSACSMPRLSRPPSSNAATMGVLSLLDKAPSMRAPSLPPLPTRGSLEFDDVVSRLGTDGDETEPVVPPPLSAAGGPVLGWRDSPLPHHGAAVPQWTSSTAAVAAASRDAAAAGNSLMDHPSQVRWRDPPGISGWPAGNGGSATSMCTPRGVAEAAMVSGPAGSGTDRLVLSPRSATRLQPSLCPSAGGGGGCGDDARSGNSSGSDSSSFKAAAAAAAAVTVAAADEMPLLSGMTCSSHSGTGLMAVVTANDRSRESTSASSR